MVYLYNVYINSTSSNRDNNNSSKRKQLHYKRQQLHYKRNTKLLLAVVSFFIMILIFLSPALTLLCTRLNCVFLQTMQCAASASGTHTAAWSEAGFFPPLAMSSLTHLSMCAIHSCFSVAVAAYTAKDLPRVQISQPLRNWPSSSSDWSFTCKRNQAKSIAKKVNSKNGKRNLTSSRGMMCCLLYFFLLMMMLP